MGLLSWITRRVDRNVERHLALADVRPLPTRQTCVSWGCGNVLEPEDALLCRRCALEVRR